MDFKTQLKKFRNQAGISVYKLSKISGIPKSTIFNYELGVSPTLEKADKLLKALGVSISIGAEVDLERIREQKPMAEYIEKNNAINLISDVLEDEWGYEGIREDIDFIISKIPAADVAEVKHGKWIEVQKENIWNDIVPVLECSACGKYTVGTRGIMTKSNYCPNCGAKMDLED